VIVSTAAIVRQPERPIRRAHLKDAMVACAVDFDATLSEDLFEDAATFVVDDVAQYRYYRQQGYFAGYPAEAVELAEVLADDASKPHGLAVYVPLGIALEDVAVAAEINRRASDAGLGRLLPL
jgi:ornithine cyclodeaminase/alanine dehydrogenase-like protein (mu-crystallin family)